MPLRPIRFDPSVQNALASTLTKEEAPFRVSVAPGGTHPATTGTVIATRARGAAVTEYLVLLDSVGDTHFPLPHHLAANLVTRI